MNTWWTADCHFGHPNILAYTGRPWLKATDLTEPYSGEGKPKWVSQHAGTACAERMNIALIRNWNSRVKPEDTVYHVGDFCNKGFANGVLGLRTKAQDYEAQLNGKIIFIKGNHDRNNGVKCAIVSALVELASGFVVLVKHIPPTEEELHALYPFLRANWVQAVVCGHVHEKWMIRQYKRQVPIVNVGTDVHKYMPLSSQEVKVIIEKAQKGEV